MNKQYAIGEVKAVESESPNGEFEVVLSMPTLDRDGEIIDVKAFDPLPSSIPVHAFHDFSDPIGRAVPRYDGDRLVARGYFASTPRAQEIRTLVADGVIGHTSVGFMPPERTVKDGVPHITKAELLEGSFVSVPSNREAAVLAVKSLGDYDHKRGRVLSGKNESALRQAVELLASVLEQLASAEEAEERSADTDPEKAAAPAAASPAEVPAGNAQAAYWRARADLLLID